MYAHRKKSSLPLLIGMLLVALAVVPSIAIAQDTTQPTPTPTTGATPTATPALTTSSSTESNVSQMSTTTDTSTQVVTPGTQVLANGVYKIYTSANTSKAIEVENDSTADGAYIQLWSDNGTKAQRFTLTWDGAGFYTVTNVESGKVLDVPYASLDSGTDIWQWASNDSDAQKWRIDLNSDGSYTLVNKASGLVLDCKSGDTEDGTHIQQWDPNNTTAQRFDIEAYQAGTQNVTPGVYTITNTNASKCLDDAEGGIAAGSNIQLWSNNGTYSQQYRLDYVEDGYYTITAIQSGRVLDVENDSTDDGANICLWDSDGSASQHWRFVDKGDGSYKLVNEQSYKVLDCAYAQVTDGTNVQLYTSNNTTAQSFTLSTTTVGRSVDDGYYELAASSDNSMTLDCADGTTTNGTNIQLWHANASAAQKFSVKYVGDGWYTVTSMKAGKVLDVAYGLADNGANVQLWDSNDSTAQKWRIVSYGGGYCLMNGVGTYLDITGGSITNGSNIQTWSGNGSSAQIFSLTDASALPEDCYILKSDLDSSKVMDVAYGSSEDGANIQITSSNGTNAQKFYVIPVSDGYYRIQNVKSGKVFDCQDCGTTDGTNIQQWDYHDPAVDTQLFKPVLRTDGTYTFVCKASPNLVLDVAYASTADGTNLQVCTSNGTAAQGFEPETTSPTLKVYLDAGHGYGNRGDGYDPGASGCGYEEATLNVELVNKIGSQLTSSYGIDVFENTDGGLYTERQSEAASLGCDAFVSIHFNASDGSASGTESYIHSYNAAEGSSLLQDCIHPQLIEGVGLSDRGEQKNNFAVCSGSVPATLLEVCFIDNEYDMSVYESRKDYVANRIAYGISLYAANR